MSIFNAVINAWAINFHAVRKDIDIAGSPERSAGRFVIEDCQHRLFVLESISPDAICHRRFIAKTLNSLQGNGFQQTITYLPDVNGDDVSYSHDGYWQLSPYISGKALDRPGYVFDKWRGKAMAEVLVALQQASQASFPMSAGNKSNILPCSPLSEERGVFSIKQYIRTLSRTIAQREPEISKRLDPVTAFLDREFMAVHDDLPVAFCHGDFHPLNIIWAENGIKKVIDWEFLGFKPEIYDLANLIGCLGMEDPHCLGGELVHALILESKEADLFSQTSWFFLVEFIVALRFAWLSEWLRKSDTEMIELEMVYFDLLIKNASTLKEFWDL